MSSTGRPFAPRTSLSASPTVGRSVVDLIGDPGPELHSGAGGDVTLTLTFAQAGAKAAKGAGTDALVYSQAATTSKAAKGIGTDALAYTEAQSGAKGAKGSGTLTLVYSEAQGGTKAGNGAGTIVNAYSLAGTGRKSAKATGTDVLTVALAQSGRKAASAGGAADLAAVLVASGTASSSVAAGGRLSHGRAARVFVPFVAERASPPRPTFIDQRTGTGAIRIAPDLVASGVPDDDESALECLLLEAA